MKKAILFGIVAVFLIVCGTATLLWTRFLNSSPVSAGTEVVYEVIPGKSFSSVAKELEQRGIITNAALFSLFARLRGEASRMKVGEYAMRTDMVPNDVLTILVSGKSIGRNFTVAEGLNIYEIAALIEEAKIGTKEEFLKEVQDPAFIRKMLGEDRPSFEGYLYPETYQITKFTQLRELVRAMVQRFLSVYSEVEADAKARGWSRHQTVTFASLIEKETGAPEERPLISSVFHNRLNQGMMLQTDPTVLYAKMRRSQGFEISITRLDLAMDDPYNTYKHKGLPPGPISNPGRDSLRAAVKPATTENLFFVSQNNGTHIFTKDYAAHQKAVMKFQMDPKARTGKSWRDLQKEKKNVNVVR